uniref:Alkyl hydroperoxide reductase subunit C/ Thiol specific antioxidant domain-containing protein n=1 Tax=Oncorhynchus kisutch TaxID=8019 RepID=A0A8C7H4G9_ONCKI
PPGSYLHDEIKHLNGTLGSLTYVLLNWGILSSHLRDYTAVCTTELGRANKLSCEFSRSNIEMIALSIDSLEDHRGWTKVSASGCAFLFPIIADSHRKLAVGLAMLDHDEKDKDGIPLTATVDFSIGPDKRLKLSLLYLPTMAWNFDEILRAVDGQQLTAQNQLATPADWQVMCVFIDCSCRYLSAGYVCRVMYLRPLFSSDRYFAAP